VKHFFENLVGKRGQITNASMRESGGFGGQHDIPFHFPVTVVAFFQFVFAAITPLCSWAACSADQVQRLVLLVPLWSTFVYAIDAFLLWGGGTSPRRVTRLLRWVRHPYVCRCIGVRPRMGSWTRLLRDRQHAIPNNLVMAAVGAGISWLGWNGFNGGDPYYAGASASAAVVNTNLATAAACSPGWGWTAWFSKVKKPPFRGVNGMICGLVASHRCRVGTAGGDRRCTICWRFAGVSGTTCPSPALLQGGPMRSGSSTPRHRRLLRRHVLASSGTRTCSSTDVAT